MVIYNRRRFYTIAVAALLVCTGVHGQDNATTTPAPIITPAATPAPPVTTEAPKTEAPTPPPATTTAPPPPSAAPTTTAPPETAAPPPPPPPPKPEPSSAAPTNAPSTSASPVITPAPAPTQAPSSPSSPTAAPSPTAAANTPAPPKSSEPTTAPPSHTSTDAPATAAVSVAPTTGSPVDAPLAPSPDSTDSTEGSSAATPPSALGSSAESPSSPSAASQQAAESKSGGGSGLTIALASVAVGAVALVMAVVIVRRRMQQIEDDDAKHVERIDDSMVFMQSTRPSSVPILQSQPRKANNSRTVPTGRTLSVRDPLEPSYPAVVPMVQTAHVPEVGGKSFRGSLPRISEAANSSNSDASSNDSHIVDMRATEDLCRFTDNTSHAPSFSGQSYHDDDEGFDSRYLSDMTRETGGWSIDEGSEISHGEVATAANAVRSTEDLLQSTRSMISIDDASARGSTEVWLDSSRFNAMVSTDVHIF